MKLETLHDLYVDELKDLYSAENQLLKALQKMANAASDFSLAQAFTDHLTETKGHVERLDAIFEKLDASPEGKHRKAMEGLLEEGKERMAEEADPNVMDAALIAVAQRVEHYEMAGYGCVRTYARLLGYDDAADLLQETLDEEGTTDKKLTDLAETVINAEAFSPVATARPVIASTHEVSESLMFCQHYASSLPLGNCRSESKRFTDLSTDTAAIVAQTRTRVLDCFDRVNNSSKPDRFRDPKDQL